MPFLFSQPHPDVDCLHEAGYVLPHSVLEPLELIVWIRGCNPHFDNDRITLKYLITKKSYISFSYLKSVQISHLGKRSKLPTSMHSAYYLEDTQSVVYRVILLNTGSKIYWNWTNSGLLTE